MVIGLLHTADGPAGRAGPFRSCLLYLEITVPTLACHIFSCAGLALSGLRFALAGRARERARNINQRTSERRSPAQSAQLNLLGLGGLALVHRDRLTAAD